MSDLKTELLHLRGKIDELLLMHDEHPDALVDYEGAARFLSVSLDTLRELVDCGDIACIVLRGEKGSGRPLLRVQMSELRRFVERKRRSAA